MTPPGPLIIVSGPSGSGKSTLIAGLLAEPPGPLRLSVSATTCGRRSNEVPGRPLPFLGPPSLRAGDRGGGIPGVCGGVRQLLRHPEKRSAAVPGGGLGGAARHRHAGERPRCGNNAPRRWASSSAPPRWPNTSGGCAKRGTENEAAIARRVAGAQQELAHVDEYQYQLINEDRALAQAEFRAIVQRELEKGANHVG